MSLPLFDDKDRALLNNHGITVSEVERQIDNFRRGFPPLDIVASAVVGDGIRRIASSEEPELRNEYRSACHDKRIFKFVPASGAATRMFKELFAFLESGVENPVSQKVVAELGRFAFGTDVSEAVGSGASPRSIVDYILNDGLGYGLMPKGLILFHKYPSGARTAFEEHLAEGAMYADADGKVNIHFTVSPEHVEAFETQFDAVCEHYQGRYGVEYEVTFSVQKGSTDTIAVNPDFTPFRTDDGRLLLRPAGHGALVENLNDIDADIIFLKTVDNVQPDRLKADTIRYKEILAGLLLSLQKRSFALLDKLDSSPETVVEAAEFLSEQLSVRMPSEWAALPAAEYAAHVARLLDRPIRVCGMVRNEGEPGGGPFWARNADSTVSLQIAESSQISPEQRHLMADATHFNPVDIVCGVRDRNGSKFDLHDFIDPTTGFISQKSFSGRPLLAQELPGLWNGTMSGWNTVFVEVPISTFSPVKTVTDLLRPEHQ